MGLYVEGLSCIGRPLLRKLFRCFYEHFSICPAQVTYVSFVSPAKMHRLNRAYCNRNRPTDVLSFPSNADEYLGQLFLCEPVVARRMASYDPQMPYYRIALRLQMRRLLAHGFCHLRGMDHHDRAGYRHMLHHERRLQDCTRHLR